MTVLHQYRVSWVSGYGQNGVSTFYNLGSPTPYLAKLKTFFEAIKGVLPNTMTIKYPQSGNDIDDTTGQPVASWLGTAPADTVGTSAGSYGGASGAVIDWNTGLFIAGRQLRGKTFLVPIVAAAFDPNGRLNAANRTTIENAANALCTPNGDMVIYSSAHHRNGAVTTATVPTINAVLRSRRD